MRKTTMAELGHRIPSGTLEAGGAFVGDVPFAFRRYTLGMAKRVAELQTLKPPLTRGQFVSALLAEMVTQLGPDAGFADRAIELRRAAFSRMALGDVLYLYTALRTACLSSGLLMKFDCGACGDPVSAEGDLRTVETRVATGPEDLTAVHKLAEGEIVTPAGQRGRVLSLKPASWTVFEDLNSPQAAVLLRFEVMKKSIAAVEGIDTHGTPLIVTDSMVDESMTLFDLELLMADVDARMPGPDLILEGRCKCRASFRRAIDWISTDFFGSASLPTQRS